MKFLQILTTAFLASTISAQASLPQGAGPKCTDAAGQNPGGLAGKGTGNQFATGCCLSDSDCATKCCGKKTGICQNLGVAVQPQVGGCGGVFGGSGGTQDTPSSTSEASTTVEDNSGGSGGGIPSGAGPKCTDAAGQNPGNLAGKGTGNQFATGCCLSDSDCATKCCGKKTGICQNLGVAVQPQVGGCGGIFGGGGGGGSGDPEDTPSATSAASTTVETGSSGSGGGIPAGAGPKCTDAAGQNPGDLAGKGTGNQFATGCCLSDSDCATGCCGKKTGICQNLGVAVQPQVGGCGGTFGTN